MSATAFTKWSLPTKKRPRLPSEDAEKKWAGHDLVRAEDRRGSDVQLMHRLTRLNAVPSSPHVARLPTSKIRKRPHFLDEASPVKPSPSSRLLSFLFFFKRKKRKEKKHPRARADFLHQLLLSPNSEFGIHIFGLLNMGFWALKLGNHFHIFMQDNQKVCDMIPKQRLPS